jgi:hypothetical protein
MVRNYRSKNAVVKGARLDQNESMGVVYNYLCQVPVKEIADGLNTTEQTIHRHIAKFQARLRADTQLLSILCGLLRDGQEFLAVHAGLIKWLAKAKSQEISKLKACIYDCPTATEMNYATFQAYAFSEEIDIEGGMDWSSVDRDATFRFRSDFCKKCPIRKIDCPDVSIISAMSLDEILKPQFRKNFERHLPAMIVRSCARWRMHKVLEEGKFYEHETLDEFDYFMDMRDEVVKTWLTSALPYLRRHPL